MHTEHVPRRARYFDRKEIAFQCNYHPYLRARGRIMQSIFQDGRADTFKCNISRLSLIEEAKTIKYRYQQALLPLANHNPFPRIMFWRPNKKPLLHRRDHGSSLVSTLASGSSSSSFYLHDPASTTVDSRSRRSISATAALSDLFTPTHTSHVYPKSSLPLPPKATGGATSGNKRNNIK